MVHSLARASILGSVAMILTVGAHAFAGGHVPGIMSLGVLTVLTIAAMIAATGRRSFGWTTVPALLGGQALLHVALALLPGGHPASVPALSVASTSTPNPRLHLHLGQSVAVDVPGSAALQAHGSLGDAWLTFLGERVLTGGLPMMLAHVVASVLVGAWLVHGERLLFRLGVLVAGAASEIALGLLYARRAFRLRAVLHRQPDASPARPGFGYGFPPPCVRPHDVLRSSVERRGPPWTCAAA